MRNGNSTFPLKLQMFAEEAVEAPEVDDAELTENLIYDDVEDGVENVGDNVDDEDIEEVDQDVDDEAVEEDEVEEDTDESEESDEPEEPDDDVEIDDEDTEDDKLFDDKQQKEVDRIIKNRLERQEAKLLKDLKEQAGTDISSEDLSGAARLWGLLKENKGLSKALDDMIDQHIREGNVRIPTEKSVSAKEVELQRKEAILDLKSSDKTFNKNSDKILNWAESQGFDITDQKSLNIAYMAWKGSNSDVIQATKKLNEKRRQSTKNQVRKKASVQSSKSGTKKKPLNYRKMSDADILSAEGLELFIE